MNKELINQRSLEWIRDHIDGIESPKYNHYEGVIKQGLETINILARLKISDATKILDSEQLLVIAKIVVCSSCGLMEWDLRYKKYTKLLNMMERSCINDVLKEVLVDYNGTDYIGWIHKARERYILDVLALDVYNRL